MTGNITDENIALLEEKISQAEAILVGAGAGLSTAAGFTYSGRRFHQWFFDFVQAYGIRDMYSGGFHPFPAGQSSGDCCQDGEGMVGCAYGQLYEKSNFQCV